MDKRRIICLPATVTLNGQLTSRITAQFIAGTIITTPRHQLDIVVTEFGAAEVAGLTTKERAHALAEFLVRNRHLRATLDIWETSSHQAQLAYIRAPLWQSLIHISRRRPRRNHTRTHAETQTHTHNPHNTIHTSQIPLTRNKKNNKLR